jgi:hypothetical protein
VSCDVNWNPEGPYRAALTSNFAQGQPSELDALMTSVSPASKRRCVVSLILVLLGLEVTGRVGPGGVHPGGGTAAVARDGAKAVSRGSQQQVNQVK